MSNVSNAPEGRGSAPRVSFFTLGCRLNQHDTAAMRSDLARAGWRVDGPAEESGTAEAGGGRADLIVVNTCTVTRRADQESRQLIRRLARERPGARIVVTGCYAQRAPEEVRRIPGVSWVLGNAERETIAAHLGAPDERPGEAGGVGVAVGPGRARREAGVPAFPVEFGRSRALLKVQDGCDSFCDYCIVPYVRGRSRSVAHDDLLARAGRLLEAGFRELVLTGADLGDYRGGRGRPDDLALLAASLLALPAPGSGRDRAGDAGDAGGWGAHRVRLSSIEPQKVDDSIVRLLESEPRLCRHLHLPLQSGSAAVLRAMRRDYRPRDYARLVERVVAAGPAAIGADVIVGHPAETEREFEETSAFLEALPIAYLHVFRFSPRPGTRAESGGRTDPLDPAAVRERAARLRALGAAKRRAFARSLVGSVRSVVVERRRTPDGSWLGTSDLYLDVAIAGASPGTGPFPVRIVGVEGEALRGER